MIAGMTIINDDGCSDGVDKKNKKKKIELGDITDKSRQQRI